MNNNVHFIWFGKRLYYKYQRQLADWARLNPQLNITFWTDEPSLSLHLPNIKVKHWHTAFSGSGFDEEVKKYVQDEINDRSFAAASNLLRFYLLAFIGGTYIDTDIACHRQLQLSQETPEHQLLMNTYGLSGTDLRHRFQIDMIYANLIGSGKTLMSAVLARIITQYRTMHRHARRRADNKHDFLTEYSGSLMLSYLFEKDFPELLESYVQTGPEAFRQLFFPAIIQRHDRSWLDDGAIRLNSESKELAAHRIQFEYSRYKRRKAKAKQRPNPLTETHHDDDITFNKYFAGRAQDMEVSPIEPHAPRTRKRRLTFSDVVNSIEQSNQVKKKLRHKKSKKIDSKFFLV